MAGAVRNVARSPVAGDDGPGEPTTGYFGYRAESLVSSWSAEQRAARNGFLGRIVHFAAALPFPGSLQVSIGREAKSPTLALRFVVTGPARSLPAIDRRLRSLLSDPASPVVAGRLDDAEVTRLMRATPKRMVEMRRAVFAADRSSRRRTMPLVIHGDRDMLGLCRALVDAEQHEIRLCVSSAVTSLSDEDLAEVLGVERRTSTELGMALARHGRPVRCQVLISCPTAGLDPLVAAELTSAGDPLELVVVEPAMMPQAVATWRGDRPEPLAVNAAPGEAILGANDVEGMFRLPVATTGTFPGFDVVPAGQIRAGLSAVRGSASSGLRIGSAIGPGGSPTDIRMSLADLSRHLYIPGQTGAGKSTALRAVATELAAAGHGFLFIDPHGETAAHLLRDLPPERVADTVYVNCADIEHPAPINPFAVTDLLERDTALANVAAMFTDLFDPGQTGIVGPRWETWFRMAMLTLIAAQGRHASLLDVPLMFLDSAYRDACKKTISEDYLLDFWDREMKQTTDYHKSEILGWFTSKFTAFRTNGVLRRILGSGHDVLDPAEIMDSSKIVIVSLDKGKIGAPVSQLLGYVYLTRFWTAALRRRTNKLFGLIVDEAHTFAKGALPDVLAEGRKFGLSAVVANQYLDQFPENIQNALLGNVGTVVAFRLGDRDAQHLGARFQPDFELDALRRLPNFDAACSLLVAGVPTPAFTLKIDHYERMATKPATEGRRQQRAIVSASRTLLRAENKVARQIQKQKDQQRADAGTRQGPAFGRSPWKPAAPDSRGAGAGAGDSDSDSDGENLVDGWRTYLGRHGSPGEPVTAPASPSSTTSPVSSDADPVSEI
ncbi:type IV secretory system conjugative DNA transfer family protein [Planosporangium sp. 12N6]|uniref:type IV secretory system conjugative DNA transfer family protein n=1 Tax=Planosporangium spinosum TaxID=3402278 RepID=UPI003CEFC062